MNERSTEIDAIKAEYIAGMGGYETLAKKHGIPKRQIAKIWKEENWRAERLGLSTEENQTETESLGREKSQTPVLTLLETEEKPTIDTSLNRRKSAAIPQYEINDELALFLSKVLCDDELRTSFLPGVKELKDFAAVLKESEQMKRRELGTDEGAEVSAGGGIVLLPAVAEVPEQEAAV